MSQAGHLLDVAVPVVFGSVVAAMVYAFGHVSGAHLNPAVTIAFVVTKQFPLSESFVYITSQIMGALAAITVLAVTLPGSTAFGATHPNVPELSAVLWEGLLSFFLMLVIMAVAVDARAFGVMAGTAIGATIMLDCFIGGWPTGASMNPARSIAPALYEANLDHLWIYIIGPVAGTTMGAVVYKGLNKQPAKTRGEAVL